MYVSVHIHLCMCMCTCMYIHLCLYMYIYLSTDIVPGTPADLVKNRRAGFQNRTIEVQGEEGRGKRCEIHGTGRKRTKLRFLSFLLVVSRSTHVSLYHADPCCDVFVMRTVCNAQIRCLRMCLETT